MWDTLSAHQESFKIVSIESFLLYNAFLNGHFFFCTEHMSEEFCYYRLELKLDLDGIIN